jgi:DNA mismatch repair protein MutS2
LARLRQETIDKARQDARDTITAARREMNQLLEQFKQDRRKETAEKFGRKQKSWKPALPRQDSSHHLLMRLKPGSVVQVRSLGRDATVISVDQSRNKVRVRAGSIEMEVPLHGLIIALVTAGSKPGQRKRNLRSR